MIETMPKRTWSERKRNEVEDKLAHKELHYRQDSQIEVFLMWHKRNNILSLILTEMAANNTYQFTVDNDRGMDAFNHPYFYAHKAGLLPSQETEGEL